MVLQTQASDYSMGYKCDLGYKWISKRRKSVSRPHSYQLEDEEEEEKEECSRKDNRSE